MTDRAPLFFVKKLNALWPANAAAVTALSGVEGRVTVKISGGRRNQRRRSLYWVLVALVTPILNDMHSLALTDEDIHDIMRDRFQMFDEIILPSGEVHKKRWSTSDRAMSEADRALYLEKCLTVWSKWIGVDVKTLRNEAELAG